MSHSSKYKIIILLITIICAKIPDFDGSKALSYIIKQCDYGPRYPGSEGHSLFKDYLVDFVTELSDSVIVYEHEIKHPYKDHNITLFNIFARFNPAAEERFIIMAHWDTREIADKDPIEENRDIPILGANDGGSGTAVLMVLSEILNSKKLVNIGVDLLFIDGEDMGRSGDIEKFCLGTRYFCESIPEPIPKYAICVDMVGDKNPSFPVEQYSYMQAPWLVEDLWTLAIGLGHSEFKYEMGAPIYDDHRALYLHSSIPAIDIIDFDFPYWHTLNDTPEHCSEYSLGIVGDVLTHYIYQQDTKFRKK